MTIGHLYLIFLIFGVLGLLSSLIFGDVDADGGLDVDSGDTDAGDTDGPKLFSIRVIFAFLLAFGIGGGSMYLSSRGLPGQLLVGFGAGIVTAFLTYFAFKFLYSFQGNSNINSNDFIGKTAVVTIPTTSTGLSQIKIDSGGGDQLFMARELKGTKLSQHDVVKVTEKVGNSFLVTKQ